MIPGKDKIIPEDLDGRFLNAFRFVSSSLGRLIRYMSDEKKELRIGLILALVAAVILMFIPLLVANFIDAVLDDWMAGTVDSDYVVFVAVLVTAILLVWYTIRTHAMKRLILLGMRVTKRMRREIDRKVLKVPISYLDSHPAGDMIALISNDMSYVYRMLSSDLTGCIVYFLTSAIITIMMLFTNFWMGLLFVILIPLSVVIAQRIGRRSTRDFIGEKKAVGALNGQVMDTLSNYRLVKAFGLEDELEEKYERMNEGHRLTFTRSRTVSGLIAPSVIVISNIGYVIAAAMGAMFMMNGMLSKGLFVAFIFYVRAVSKPMTESSSAISTIQAEMASLNRILDLIDEDEMPDDSSSEPLDVEAVRGEVSLEDVHFSYSEGAEVLHGVSFTVPSGAVAAIIGHTGSGKSTMTNLMLKFYEPDFGKVTLDGRDISTIGRDDLTKVCGPILQTPWIFNGTVMDNIRYGKETSDDDVIRTSEVTGLAPYVRRLTDGYETVIGDRGYLPSLIEMKLIALTRIMLSDPKIMVLDESTSGLDPRSEMRIMDSLKAAMKGRTVIMTTHNILMASKADIIVLMESGRVAECGSHEELMALNRKYSELYRMSV